MERNVDEKNVDEQNLDEQADMTSEDTANTDEAADTVSDSGEDEGANEDGGEQVQTDSDGQTEAAPKDKKTSKMQERIDELEDKVKRQMAEFDNFRKRTEKEKSAMFETGAKSVVEKILPVVDNFERGLAALSPEELKLPFAEGMSMVYKQLITELEKLDVKPIESVGCEFNPELHNAVMQVESEEYESGIIAQELQKGYTYRDSVVRHSMVAVVS